MPKLSSVVNFRDVGATVNSFLGERYGREHLSGVIHGGMGG